MEVNDANAYAVIRVILEDVRNHPFIPLPLPIPATIPTTIGANVLVCCVAWAWTCDFFRLLQVPVPRRLNARLASTGSLPPSTSVLCLNALPRTPSSRVRTTTRRPSRGREGVEGRTVEAACIAIILGAISRRTAASSTPITTVSTVNIAIGTTLSRGVIVAVTVFLPSCYRARMAPAADPAALDNLATPRSPILLGLPSHVPFDHRPPVGYGGGSQTKWPNIDDDKGEGETRGRTTRDRRWSEVPSWPRCFGDTGDGQVVAARRGCRR